MVKSPEAFRSIGEVASLIGVAPHVLRYWETQFTALRPMKRGDGRRYYRPADLTLAAGICRLLRDQGLTIRGARRLIAQDKGQAVRVMGQDWLDRDRPADPLPLFADGLFLDDPAPTPAPAHAPRRSRATQPDIVPCWLGRLARLTQLLQGLRRDDPRWPRLHDRALALADAMLRLS